MKHRWVRLVAVGGLMVVAGCSSKPVGSPARGGNAGAADVPQGGVIGTTDGGQAGAASSTAGGGSGGDVDVVNVDGAGAAGQGGEAGQSSEAGQGGVPPGVTTVAPDMPFMVQAFEDPSLGACYGDNVGRPCDIGPWTVRLEPRADGGFDGAWIAVDGSTVEAFELRPERDHYQMGSTTLANYNFTGDVVPGVCASGAVWLFDDSGDGVADVFFLLGTTRTQGVVSADWDVGCGEELYPLELVGRATRPGTLDFWPLSVSDPLHPSIRTPPQLERGATVTFNRSRPEALTLAGGIYGYRWPFSVAPGSNGSWHIVHDSSGVTVTINLDATFPKWPLITDGTFETSFPEPDGYETPLTRTSNDVATLEGQHSLLLTGGGTTAAFRFTQPTGTHLLHFSSSAMGYLQGSIPYGRTGLGIELAPVGQAAVESKPTSSKTVAGFDVTLDVPEANVDREVLIRFTNRIPDYGLAETSTIVLDSLHFE